MVIEKQLIVALIVLLFALWGFVDVVYRIGKWYLRVFWDEAHKSSIDMFNKKDGK